MGCVEHIELFLYLQIFFFFFTLLLGHLYLLISTHPTYIRLLPAHRDRELGQNNASALIPPHSSYIGPMKSQHQTMTKVCTGGDSFQNSWKSIHLCIHPSIQVQLHCIHPSSAPLWLQQRVRQPWFCPQVACGTVRRQTGKQPLQPSV